jgi:hypothetical protein
VALPIDMERDPKKESLLQRDEEYDRDKNKEMLMSSINEEVNEEKEPARGMFNF